jgi:predicted sugar kinase
MHIVARPRIHVSLADMGFASLRAFGGIGFSIEQPLTIFQFEPCSGVEIHGLDVLDEEGNPSLSSATDPAAVFQTAMVLDHREIKVAAPSHR